MAANEFDVDKIVNTFRDIVKRKTSYNETNLHYEYFKRAGDTIPYKAHGYQSLRDFIQKNAGDIFYFERVAKDLEFIAPRRVDGSCSYSMESAEPKKVSITKKFDNIGLYSGSEKAKSVCVSHNIYFGKPQSTGVNNPFQNIRNDIKISFDFDSQTREVDRCTTNDEQVTDSDCDLTNDEKQLAIRNDAIQCAYSSDPNNDEQMDIEDYDNMDLPWNDRYWHLKITHAVSTNEIWARFFHNSKVKC